MCIDIEIFEKETSLFIPSDIFHAIGESIQMLVMGRYHAKSIAVILEHQAVEERS